MIILIDGKECACEKGEYVLNIASRNGIFIPRFCHHEGLPGQASCRVCIVEAETGGYRQVVASCVYPVEQEMRIYTNSEKIKNLRAMVLSLLSARAPGSDRAAAMLKHAGGAVPDRFTALPGERCIVCGLCARACESVGPGAISTIGRGIEKRVSTPYDAPSDACIGCASCAAACPTEAIKVSEDAHARTIWGKAFPLVHCEKCGETLGTAEELAFAAKTSGHEAPKLCGACRKKAIADVLATVYGH
jgi:NADH dehydrogenase/NADH:ubiquinone oxidoreductase subunit G